MNEFLAERHQEWTKIHVIPPTDLNGYLSEFIINVRKINGEEYEASYLRELMSSFDRQLSRHKYSYVIISSPEFADTREAMRAKQKNLKSQGKFLEVALPQGSGHKLYETNQLGIETPTTVITPYGTGILCILASEMALKSAIQLKNDYIAIQLKNDYIANLDYLEFHERTL